LRTVSDILARRAQDRSDQVALIGSLRRYTYREMSETVEAGAAALYAVGVRQGDRVACTAPNQTDIMIAFLAVQRLGAVWVGISKFLAGPETLFQLQNSGASFFLGDNAALAKLQSLGEEASLIRRTIDMEAGENEWVRLIEAHRGKPAPQVDIDPLAPAGIAYTSGTTGHPKGAVICQHSMVTMSAHSASRAVQGGTERRAATSPLTILNMIISGGLPSFVGGGSFVCMDRQDAVGVAEWIERERVEAMACAPPTIRDFITRDEISPSMLASMVTLSCGGGACPQDLRDGYLRKFGKPIHASYGLTEAPTGLTGNFASECPPDSCGTPFSHVEMAIRAPDGQVLPAGERGEICVRPARTGPWEGVYTPMLGYWDRPEATADTLDGPWLRTGDIGYLDDNGFAYVVDRAKLVILRGGQNIYPAEIERVLKQHPGVKDAAVLGMPSARFDESVLAVIEMESGDTDEARLKAELTAACTQSLAKYKWPEAWIFRPELPRNAMMKINRPLLKTQCEEMLEPEGSHP
jgi:acyl-CoA synthetase (AMP-forming)/AMP-acid ligase II